MLRLPSGPTEVRWLLSRGQRIDAANRAIQLVSKESDDVREIVNLLADSLRSTGDRHTKRGRPKASPTIVEQLRRSYAVRAYQGAIYCRRLIDNDTLTPEELADCAWFIGPLVPDEVPKDLELTERHRKVAEFFARDISSAREELRPHALSFLKLYNLGRNRVPRRGFRKQTLETIAKNLKLTASVLASEIRK